MKKTCLAVLIIALFAAPVFAGEEWRVNKLEKNIDAKLEVIDKKIEKLSLENKALRKEVKILKQRMNSLKGVKTR